MIRILFVSLWFLDVCMYYIYVYTYIYGMWLFWPGLRGGWEMETGRRGDIGGFPQLPDGSEDILHCTVHYCTLYILEMHPYSGSNSG